MFLSPPHFHYLPPTVIALSIETWAETASERTKLGRAFQVWSPTSVFCYSFPSSFSFAFRLCASGTIFMFSCSMVNVAVKQTFTPFSFDCQCSGSKCERYNCHAHSFAASDRWWLQAFRDCGTRGRGNSVGHGERERLVEPTRCCGWFSLLWGFGKVRRANVFSFWSHPVLLKRSRIRQGLLEQHWVNKLWVFFIFCVLN